MQINSLYLHEFIRTVLINLKSSLMPATKNPLVRYMILDRCFRNTGRLFTINDLARELKVSKRTIYNDILFMESEEGFGMEFADLKAEDGKTKYYRYANPALSINNKPLSEAEINVISDMLSTLKHFKGMPQLEWLYEVMPRLEEMISMNHDEKSHPIMGFDQNIYLKGIEEYLPTLFHAIKSKTVLKIEYRTYNDIKYNWTIHPYYLKQYNNRWFLLGLNEKGLIANLAIDRIESINPALIPYIPNEEIDFDEYFDDIIGVTFDRRHENKTKILLQFDERRWPYIVSKPLHHSQINKGDRTIELNVRINKELISQILSYGNQVTVISPEELRMEIKEIYQQALNKYE